MPLSPAFQFVWRHLPKILTALLLAGLYLQRQSQPPQPDAPAFHARVRAAVDAIPYRLGEWEGADVAVPPAAQALLRPNAIFARAYYSPTRRTRATLIIVQCRDTRDMIGHYPPACYPAHGWAPAGDPAPVDPALEGAPVPALRHEFSQTGFNRRREMVIYSFFVLPSAGVVRDMIDVRHASSDFRTRGLGAAQFQVLMEAGLTPAEEAGIFQELLAPLSPMIQLLGSSIPAPAPAAGT